MNQPENIFFNSSLGKITRLIELHGEFNNIENLDTNEVIEVSSMKEIPGW